MGQNKIILGFVGEVASGKGTSSKYLNEKYGAPTFRFSTILRDLMKRLYIPETRENLVTLSELLRKNFGDDVLARAMAEDVKNSPAKIITIDGVRRPADIRYLKNVQGFHLVEIFADVRKRFERIILRRENPDDATKTWDEFQKDAELPTEITIREVAKNAEQRVNNNGDLKELHYQLDSLVKNYEAAHNKN